LLLLFNIYLFIGTIDVFYIEIDPLDIVCPKTKLVTVVIWIHLYLSTTTTNITNCISRQFILTKLIVYNIRNRTITTVWSAVSIAFYSGRVNIKYTGVWCIQRDAKNTYIMSMFQAQVLTIRVLGVSRSYPFLYYLY